MSFVGIIHPRTFQIRDLLSSLTELFVNASPSRFNYKNLEFDSLRSPIISNAKKDCHLLLIGQLENAHKLSEELKGLGYLSIANTNDLLFAGYQHFGETLFEKLEGDFSLILFDQRKELLYLVRDPFGKRVIYWTIQGDFFLFSSHIKGLIASGLVPQTPSMMGFSSYLYLGYFSEDLTPIKGVNKLPAGHFLRVNLRKEVSSNQYFSYSKLFEKKEKLTHKAAEERFLALLKEQIHQIEPAGSLMVDGIDTLGQRALLGLLRKAQRSPLVAIQESLPIERERKKTLLQENHFSSIDIAISPKEILQSLPKMVWEMDEPIASHSSIYVYNAMKMAIGQKASFVSSVGFELIQFFSSHFELSQKDLSCSFGFRLAKLPKKLRDKWLLPILRHLDHPLRWEMLRNIEANLDQMNHLSSLSLFKNHRREAVSPRLFSYFDPEIFLERFHRFSAENHSSDPLLYIDVKTRVFDSSYFQYERLATSRGVAFKAPFLSSEFLKYFAKIPYNLRERGDLFQNALKSESPFRITGKNALDNTEPWWTDSHFRHAFMLLEKGLLVEEGLISPHYLRHELGFPYLVEENFKELFALLVWEVWFRLFINAPLSRARSEMSLEALLNE